MPVVPKPTHINRHVPKRIKNRLDQSYGDLTVVGYLGRHRYGESPQSASTMWLCLCRCGNYCKVDGGNLHTGLTNSCGCRSKKIHTTHGQSYSRTYKVWSNHKGRNVLSLKWHDFQTFLADVGECPEGCHLWRPDFSQPYGPGNGEWVLISQLKIRRHQVAVDQFIRDFGDESLRQKLLGVSKQRLLQLRYARKGKCRYCGVEDCKHKHD